jgi:MFS family permease
LNPFQTLLRHRNFRLFWFGQTLSLIGTWMQVMAEGWLALQLSNSAFVVGLVAAAQSLPVMLVSLHAGVIVDRSDKLRIVKIAQTLLGLEATTLWWLTWSGHITIGWLLTMATANGLISAFEIPARQSLVIELVNREDLPGAIALNSSGFNLARIIGPSVGAIIIAKLGMAWCFGVNALSYITVLGGLFLLRLPAWLPPAHLAAPLEGIREGVRYMRETPSVSRLMRLVTVYSVLGVPYLTLMPVMARDRLGLDAGGYGALLACVGIGGVSGALVLAAIGDRVRRGQVLRVGSYGFSILLILFSLVRSAAFAYPILLGVGFSMIVNSAVANATLQHLVPNELRGRMMAAYSLIVVGLSSVVGSLVAGTVAHVIGVSWAIGGGALIMLVYSYWAFERQTELRAV